MKDSEAASLKFIEAHRAFGAALAERRFLDDQRRFRVDDIAAAVDRQLRKTLAPIDENSVRILTVMTMAGFVERWRQLTNQPGEGGHA